MLVRSWSVLTARGISMTYDHIRVTPLATSVGAEISGVDLATPPDGPGVAEIRRALGEYGVVFLFATSS
jgi:alpha-ketoglutarate-dependent taurine dioxygenase